MTQAQRAEPHTDRQLGLRFQWLGILGNLMAFCLAVLVLAINTDGLIGIIAPVAIGIALLTVMAMFLINLRRAERLAERVHDLSRHHRGRRRGLLLV
ncbi:hypothetical protein [Amycolatopsis anabasis]|uniref:hypothetical protein n=1 Tax=Amycolatopsis anabasis TaxID=1840409 RepID=UPI00131B0F49|nr:hypothetical protein [Amycolatopsis anabasis]